MDFDILITYGGRLIEGAFVTVELVVLCSLIGLCIAVPLALARMSPKPWINAPAYAYIYFFRGTPLLVQLFLVYYGLGQFDAVRESIAWFVLRDAFWCGLITLTLNTAAYVAEILRGGMTAVPHGEVEAGRACGMSTALLYRRIILPRAMRIAWPAYGNEIILMLKGSALVSTITVLDLMGQTRTIFSRTYDLSLFVYAGIIYFALALAVSLAFRAYERRINRYLRRRESDSAAAKAA